MALESKKQNLSKYLIIALIPLAALGISTFIVHESQKPEVVKNSGFHRDGYPDVPTTYEITASPALVYSDFWETGKLLIILGWIIAIAGPVVYFKTREASGKESSNWIAFLFWVAGISLVFGLYADRRGQMVYRQTITEQVYQANENDLDNLFK
jgi:hypothetical protein